MRVIEQITCFVSLMIITLSIYGCATKPYVDPVSVMLDTSRPGKSRLRAMAQIAEKQDVLTSQQKQRYIKSLHGLTWNDSHPLPIRQKAAQTLIQLDKQAFLETSNDLITIVDQWSMLDYLFSLAEHNQWKSYTLAAVHSWARTSQIYDDGKRPERHLIQSLNPDAEPEQILLDVFLGNYRVGDFVPTERQQIAAWITLCRILPQQKLYAKLSESPKNSTISNDLAFMKKYLTQLPREREGLLWINHILHSDTRLGPANSFDELGIKGAFWRQDLQIRHLPTVLQHVRAKSSPNPSVTSLAQMIDRQQHFPRVDHPHEEQESFASQLKKLSPADLLVIAKVMEAVMTPSVQVTLFEQADRDLTNKQTELGGVLTWAPDNQPVAKPFEPEICVHDRKFYASNQLIESMYTGLAHYHFHAQEYENAAYSGPGRGDRKFADRLGTHAVVFTFIDQDTLNVDYYQPNDVVIDLGTIKRP